MSISTLDFLAGGYPGPGGSQLVDTPLTVGRRAFCGFMIVHHAGLDAQEAKRATELRVQHELTRRVRQDGRNSDGRAGALGLFCRWCI